MKTTGAVGLLFGAVVVSFFLTHYYGHLPATKYVMTVGVMFGGFFCYIGFVSLRFRERETGLYVYETDI